MTWWSIARKRWKRKECRGKVKIIENKRWRVVNKYLSSFFLPESTFHLNVKIRLKVEIEVYLFALSRWYRGILILYNIYQTEQLLWHFKEDWTNFQLGRVCKTRRFPLISFNHRHHINCHVTWVQTVFSPLNNCFN